VEVDGGEVSLTNYGRTRDLLSRLWFNRSDVPASCISRVSSLHISTGRGSPPKLGDVSSTLSRRNEYWIYFCQLRKIEWL
jgi:hypothetical protein